VARGKVEVVSGVALLACVAAVVAGCLLTSNIDDVSRDFGAPVDGGDARAEVAIDAPAIDTLFPIDDGAVVCGQDGQPCCEGGSCKGSLLCDPPTLRCHQCGGEGQACCNGGSCSVGLACNGSGKCVASTPPPCGGDGQSCCSGGACGADLVCNGSTCIPCGGNGQPCCGGDACGAGLECQSGSCAPPPPPPPCGGLAQPCCPGAACGSGLVCASGSCVTCGGILQPCCGGGACGSPGVCIGATCEECCALCNNRTAYHQTGATSGCDASATAYCAISDRGGLKDAKWGSCGP
jgi:hypothetical protein